MNPELLVIGHRGAKGLYPENTIGSIEKAISCGVHMVEVDVHSCSTGEVVVIHDDKLERTTNGTGYVSRKPLSYLKTLDAGQGEQIPTLREVLDHIDGRIGINIEIKGRGAVRQVLKIVKEYAQKESWSVDQFIVSTFVRKKLKRLTRLDGNIHIGALLAYRPWGFIAFAKKINAYSVHLNLKLASPKLIRLAQKAGMRVYIWTVNEPEDIERMISYGVDGIFTDYPDRISTGKKLLK